MIGLHQGDRLQVPTVANLHFPCDARADTSFLRWLATSSRPHPSHGSVWPLLGQPRQGPLGRRIDVDELSAALHFRDGTGLFSRDDASQATRASAPFALGYIVEDGDEVLPAGLSTETESHFFEPDSRYTSNRSRRAAARDSPVALEQLRVHLPQAEGGLR